MKKLKSAALAGAMTLAPLAATAATDLVSNGGFENGLAGWVCSSDFCNVSSDAQSGTSAIQGFENIDFASLSQTIDTVSGYAYDFSFWSKAYYENPGNVVGYRLNGSDMVTQLATAAYTQISDSFVATGSQSLIELFFATDPGTGTIFLDDVSAVSAGLAGTQPSTAPVPLPASLSMLLVAAGGLGVAARRRRAATTV